VARWSNRCSFFSVAPSRFVRHDDTFSQPVQLSPNKRIVLVSCLEPCCTPHFLLFFLWFKSLFTFFLRLTTWFEKVFASSPVFCLCWDPLVLSQDRSFIRIKNCHRSFLLSENLNSYPTKASPTLREIIFEVFSFLLRSDFIKPSHHFTHQHHESANGIFSTCGPTTTSTCVGIGKIGGMGLIPPFGLPFPFGSKPPLFPFRWKLSVPHITAITLFRLTGCIVICLVPCCFFPRGVRT